MQANQQRPVRVVSAVLEDGTVIEAVQHPPHAATRLVIARGTDIEVKVQWTSDGVEHVPVPAATTSLSIAPLSCRVSQRSTKASRGWLPRSKHMPAAMSPTRLTSLR
jgi:hypothetical protein